MSKATRATRMLQDAGVAFTVYRYDDDPHADKVGGINPFGRMSAPPGAMVSVWLLP